MSIIRAIPMPDATAPVQSLTVFDGRAFTVSDGANVGDGLSFAVELQLDDIYRLDDDAQQMRLSLQADHAHFSIVSETETGVIGAAVCVDCAVTLMSPDGVTTDALILVELEADGHVDTSYLLPLSPLTTRVDYALVGVDTETARKKLAQVGSVSFSRGTHITLANGNQIPIEDLSVGDKVLSRDAGPQEIRWIGQSTVRATGAFAPIRISKGALNNTNDLIVSPDHRLFIYQRQDKLGAGRSELLVKARHLINGSTVTVMRGGFVDYFQLLFDTHQIIYAEGIAAESFLTNHTTAAAIPDDLSKDMIGASDKTLSGLDVDEALLQRSDATDLLRTASKR